MIFRSTFWLAMLTVLLVGCASAPQSPIDVSKNLPSIRTAKLGVAMTVIPTADTAFPGASCLLCLATASIGNKALTTHVQTLPSSDLASLKGEMVKLLVAKGFDATAIDDPLVVDNLPNASGKDLNHAKRDFSSLKAKYKVDKLLVIAIASLGVHRNYSSYIPTGNPMAVVSGEGYLVNLNSNVLEWYLPINISKGADGNWDEAPKFPGLTNAYFQAIELGKEAIKKPFE